MSSGSSGTSTGGNGGSGGGMGGSGGTGACATDSDCNDGFSCTIDTCTEGVCSSVIGPNTGATACPPGKLCKLGEGCVAVLICANDETCIQQLGDDACKTNIHCDAATSVCAYDTLDKDADGHPPAVCGGKDCDDSMAGTYPGAPELCDGKDNSCNGMIDESATCPGGIGVCQNGACACPPANTCGADCVDKSTSNNHCGMCNNACLGAATCMNGQCTCPMGSVTCNGVCVDTKADELNCGGCGKACAPGYTCNNSFCTCLGTPCGAQCLDTTNDSLNCGGCNIACPAGSTCQNSACVCAAPKALCAGQCVDTKTNKDHCGACNMPCSGVCQNGACQPCTLANLYLFFDISGSMADSAIGGTKLDVAKSGVNAFVNDAMSANMGLGLGYHPVTGTAKTCFNTGMPCMVDADCMGPFPFCAAGTTDSCTIADYATPVVGLAPSPGVNMAITNSLSMQAATGGSLPPPGLEGALQYAKGYAGMHPAEKVAVVLLTDGLPNICTNNADTPNDLIPIAQQYATGSPPVLTYVIGIGTGSSPTLAQWSQIAAAGGTGAATLTNSAIEIQNALSSIRAQFKTCP